MSQHAELIERATQWSIDRAGSDPTAELSARIEQTDGVDRAELLRARAKAHQASDPPGAEADSIASATLFEEAGDRAAAAEQRAFAAWMAEIDGDYQRAVRHATAASVLLADPDPGDTAAARAAGALCLFYGQIGAFELALPWGRLAVHHATSAADSPPPFAPLFNYGFLSLEAAKATADAEARTTLLAEAKAMADRLVTLPDAGARDLLGRGLAAEVSLETGDPTDAQEHLRRGSDSRDSAAPQIAPWYDFVTASVHARLGDDTAAQPLLDAAIVGLETHADDHVLVRALELRSELRARRGDPGGALVDANRRADIARRWQLERTASLCELVAGQAELQRDGTQLLLRTEELARAASEDPLTGLYSRRWLDHRLTEIESMPRDGAVLLLDLDHFKSINDRYGHSEGDRVLEAVADVLRKSFRQDDVVRYGGEEFLIPLACDRATALAAGERVRRAVHTETFDAFPEIRLSVSVGVATGPMRRVRELVDRADEALYRAKREGRNRVVAAEPLH